MPLHERETAQSQAEGERSALRSAPVLGDGSGLGASCAATSAARQRRSGMRGGAIADAAALIGGRRFPFRPNRRANYRNRIRLI